MEVNFFALVEMTRAALPLLKQGRRPIIVNVSSILGHRGVPHNSEYAASKFAVHGFSESIRAEFAATGIDVLVVSPGTTETEFFDQVIESNGGPKWPEHTAVTAERWPGPWSVRSAAAATKSFLTAGARCSCCSIASRPGWSTSSWPGTYDSYVRRSWISRSSTNKAPCLVVCKPPGVLTQAPPGIDSLEVRIKAYLGGSNGPDEVYLGVPHRLDRPATGAIVFAKDLRTTRKLAPQFENRRVHKVYWACVEGHVRRKPAAGRISCTKSPASRRPR